MIRPAELKDIPRLLEMGKEFADEAGVTQRTGWDEADVTALLETLITSDDGIVLVSDEGMIGGYVSGHAFNQSARMFVELFWRAKDGNGRNLLNEAEAIAKTRGAQKSIMIAMDDMDRTKAIYQRLGYAPIEAQYMKELT